MSYHKSDFASEPHVSPDVLADFEGWLALLEKWNKTINLVSKSAMENFWQRHALDSWQIWEHITPKDQSFIDLGSGAGFPGLAIAIGLKRRGRGHITLVESAGKKANFLRTVIRRLELPAKVISERAESLPAQTYDVITARAFAPLPQLLTYAQPFWGEGTTAWLLKGQGAETEIAEARRRWQFDVGISPSRSDPDAALLKLTNLSLSI